MVAHFDASPYEVLGVARDAPESLIRSAYRRLALQHHPDKDTAEDATAKFQQIQEAYESLVTPERRKEQDYVFTDSQSRLKSACESGDVVKVRSLLEQRADVNALDNLGLAAIHHAVGAFGGGLGRGGTQTIPVLRALFEADVHPDDESSGGHTALFFASSSGYVPLVSFLLARRAAPESPNPEAPSPLMQAVEKGHLPIVKMLLGSNVSANFKDCDNVSALTSSIRSGHSEVAKCLLHEKADPTLEEELSPLYVAVEGCTRRVPGMLQIAELLIQAKADVMGSVNDPRAPLALAAQTNQVELNALLIDNLESQKRNRYWEGSEFQRNASLINHLCLPFVAICASCFPGLGKSQGNRAVQ